jgi:LysR family transcriptional regulator, hydrogen peroxide-inducible genes activator
MALNQLTFRDLEYLITVAEQLHFGSSARKLGVSQPTLSEQVKKCELLFGHTLFERSHKGVRLTKKGEEALPKIKQIWLSGENLFQELTREARPLSGEFHLGIIATLAPYLTPHLLPRLKKDYSELRLFLKEGLTDELLNDVVEGKLDAVIASRTFDLKPFQAWDLFFEPFLYATAQKIKDDKIQMNQISQERLMLLTEGNCLTDETWQFCFRSKPKNPDQAQATSLETLRQMIALNLGDSFFPSLAVHSNPLASKLVYYYPFKDKKIGREIVLVTRAGYADLESMRALSSLIKKEMSVIL